MKVVHKHFSVWGKQELGDRKCALPFCKLLQKFRNDQIGKCVHTNELITPLNESITLESPILHKRNQTLIPFGRFARLSATVSWQFTVWFIRRRRTSSPSFEDGLVLRYFVNLCGLWLACSFVAISCWSSILQTS